MLSHLKWTRVCSSFCFLSLNKNGTFFQGIWSQSELRTRQKSLTGLAVVRQARSVSFSVDRNHGDGVASVWKQFVQNGGGGAL